MNLSSLYANGSVNTEMNEQNGSQAPPRCELALEATQLAAASFAMPIFSELGCARMTEEEGFLVLVSLQRRA